MRGRRYTALKGLWPKLHGLAVEKRAEPTPAEEALWHALRGRRFRGFKFRRQHPIGPFIVDFLCPEQHLVVEVDGPGHNRTRAEDRDRQRELEALGLRVFRCQNHDVLNDPSAVFERLSAFVDGAD